MAIPFCFKHDLDWQDGCDGCAAGRSVREAFDEHRVVHPTCTSWPLCDCASGGGHRRDRLWLVGARVA